MTTKQEIIAHAMTLLMQKGYYNWSYEHISKHVGIKKASIHYYFPSKENLVAEVLKIYIHEIIIKLDEIVKEKSSNIKKIQKLIGAYRDSYESPNEICLCTILASDYHILSPEISEQLEFFYSKLHGWLTALLDKGIKAGEFKTVDASSTAYLLISTLQGLLIISKIATDPKAFDLSVKQFFSLIKKE